MFCVKLTLYYGDNMPVRFIIFAVKRCSILLNVCKPMHGMTVTCTGGTTLTFDPA